MIELLAIISVFFLISFLVFIILVGIKFLYSLASIGQSKNIFSEGSNNQHIDNSKEDSQGDGLVLFDDPLFPEETDE